MRRPDELWQNAPPTNLELAANAVHIWKVNVDAGLSAASNSFANTHLSDEEIARANCFHFEKDRRRFTRSHSALRRILARYLSLRPAEIQFVVSNNGKPQVIVSQNDRGLQFNLSHSGAFALIGVAQGRRIGVDVECYRSLEYLEIAKRYFSPSEYGEICALAADDIQKNFFACWTRKEALLKALGEGIGTLLDKVSVTVAHSELPKVRDLQPDLGVIEQWFLMEIPVHEGYAAAIAFENGPVDIRYCCFDGADGRGPS